ncbi:MAG TPA: spermidine synthase [Candidatus Nanopusillus sp.]|nr:spermidine synthase [Candidatus Nanopusillus sp.]
MTYLYFLDRYKNQYELIPIEDLLFYGKTKYQEVLIAKNDMLGTFLVLDGQIQSAESDEYRYHETITLPALVVHKNPKKVLVVGNGEGTIIRYLVKFPLERIIWVDIDEELVKICKKYLPYSFKEEDPRVQFYATDGLEFLRKGDEKYDIIIFDLTDPSEDIPLSNELYSKDTAILVKEHLNKDGIFVTLAYEYVDGKWKKSSEYLKEVFKIVRYYGVWVPSFDMYTIFAFASDVYDPLKISSKEIDDKIKGMDLRFYNALTHKFMFSLIF